MMIQYYLRRQVSLPEELVEVFKYTPHSIRNLIIVVYKTEPDTQGSLYYLGLYINDRLVRSAQLGFISDRTQGFYFQSGYEVNEFVKDSIIGLLDMEYSMGFPVMEAMTNLGDAIHYNEYELIAIETWEAEQIEDIFPVDGMELDDEESPVGTLPVPPKFVPVDKPNEVEEDDEEDDDEPDENFISTWYIDELNED